MINAGRGWNTPATLGVGKRNIFNANVGFNCHQFVPMSIVQTLRVDFVQTQLSTNTGYI